MHFFLTNLRNVNQIVQLSLYSLHYFCYLAITPCGEYKMYISNIIIKNVSYYRFSKIIVNLKLHRVCSAYLLIFTIKVNVNNLTINGYCSKI